MRPIDADALKSWIDCGHLRRPTELCFSEQDVVRIIDMRPTIDAVPVVRCKDCHFWTPSGVFGEYVIGGVYEYGRCPYFSETRECFYCQYGQKRTSNEEVTK